MKHLILLAMALVLIGTAIFLGASGRIYPKQCFPILGGASSNHTAYNCKLHL